MTNPNLNGNEEEPQTPTETEQEEQPSESTLEDEKVPSENEKYLEEKFSNSTRENQRIMKEMKLKDAKIEELEFSLSDEELKDDNPNYEYMEEEDKIKYKKERQRDKDIATLKAKEQMREDFGMLPQDIRTKLEMKGGYDIFRDFACLPENAGQKSLLSLAKSFLYEEAIQTTPVEPEKRQGLETGTGGERTTPPKPSGFTLNEIKHIRENDYERYMKLAKEGKLKIVK